MTINYQIRLEGHLSDIDGCIKCFVANEAGVRYAHGTLFMLQRDAEGKLCLYRCSGIDPVLITDLKLNCDATGAIIFE